MKIITKWQYRYIEHSLYNYNNLCKNANTGDKLMKLAIDEAIKFFGPDTKHFKLIKEFYMDTTIVKNRNNFIIVCNEKLFTEEQTGYNIRHEVVYRVAMNCFGLGLFNLLATGSIK